MITLSDLIHLCNNSNNNVDTFDEKSKPSCLHFRSFGLIVVPRASLRYDRIYYAEIFRRQSYKERPSLGKARAELPNYKLPNVK